MNLHRSPYVPRQVAKLLAREAVDHLQLGLFRLAMGRTEGPSGPWRSGELMQDITNMIAGLPDAEAAEYVRALNRPIVWRELARIGPVTRAALWLGNLPSLLPGDLQWPAAFWYVARYQHAAEVVAPVRRSLAAVLPAVLVRYVWRVI